MSRLLLSVLGAVLCTSTLAAVPAVAEPVAPGTEAPAAARLVTLKASSSDRVGGQRLVLKGKVRTERGVKRLVQLHAQVLGEWDAVAHVRTNRKGAYKFVVTSPNPAAGPVRLGFRVEAVGTANKKLRKAWRKHSRSTVTRVTFRNNPAIAQPTYSLADPVACDSGTPGVMAKTAACIAAVEVQLAERMWLDMRRLERLERDTDRILQFGVQLVELGSLDPDFAYLRLVLPHSSAALLAEDFAADQESVEMFLFAFLWIGAGIQEEVEAIDPGAKAATAWKPEWTEHFIVKDLNQVVVSGDTATTPERTFTNADSGKLTLGGPWKYVAGRWYSAESPTLPDERTAVGGWRRVSVS